MNMAAAYALRKAEYGFAVRTSMRDAVHRICSVGWWVRFCWACLCAGRGAFLGLFHALRQVAGRSRESMICCLSSLRLDNVWKKSIAMKYFFSKRTCIHISGALP